MAILKTDFEHLRGVRENAKHATDGQLTELKTGGTALIQVTALSSPTSQPLIEYAMTYTGCYPNNGETEKIWGRHWNYVVRGVNLYRLAKPFAIRHVQVSRKNYGQGAIRFAYVVPEDVAAIRSGGYLQPRAVGGGT